MANGADYTPYQPQSTESFYQRQLGRLMPDIRRQRSQQAQFLQQQMQRMGAINPQLTSRQAVEPYAQAIGKAGASAALSAEQLGEQERQFAEKVNIQRAQMAQQQAQFEQKLAEMQAERKQQGQLGLLPYTGFTPELLQTLGLGDTFSRQGLGDWRQFQRTLGRYNLPGQPFAQAGGPSQGLTAAQKLSLSKFYPGASRSYKNLAASNWGWQPQGSWGY